MRHLHHVYVYLVRTMYIYSYYRVLGNKAHGKLYNFYSQMSQAVHAKMEVHAGILQDADELLLLAYVHLDILAADVK